MSAANARQLIEWADVPPRLALLTVRVAKAHGFNLVTIRSGSRKRPLFQCRRLIAMKARKQGYSYPQIGRALNRDHTTIMHAVGAV